jgi:hypothetical protein
MYSYNILDRSSNKSDRCLWILAKHCFFLTSWQRQNGYNSTFLCCLYRQKYRWDIYSLVNRNKIHICYIENLLRKSSIRIQNNSYHCNPVLLLYTCTSVLLKDPSSTILLMYLCTWSQVLIPCTTPVSLYYSCTHIPNRYHCTTPVLLLRPPPPTDHFPPPPV